MECRECRSAGVHARMPVKMAVAEDMRTRTSALPSEGYAVVEIAVSSSSQFEAGTYTGEPDCTSSAWNFMIQ